ncbi:hypothetical protein BGZ63DRAFT_448140 [Mariannaea sp. PMI_226]|nr:hypothetical protein BGZ63DRAFT_448140 [Mariannaea sp. PMI_226]
MKPSISALVIFIAGYAIAAGVNGGNGAAIVKGQGKKAASTAKDITQEGTATNAVANTATNTAPNTPSNVSPDVNRGSITIPGNRDQVKSQLNSFSYEYILNAVGGKYGPFYIEFKSSDTTMKGSIQGEIDERSYSYKWTSTL